MKIKKILALVYISLIILIIIDTFITIMALHTMPSLYESNIVTKIFVGYFGIFWGVLLSGLGKSLLVISIYYFFDDLFFDIIKIPKNKSLKNYVNVCVFIILFLGIMSTLSAVLWNIILIINKI